MAKYKAVKSFIGKYTRHFNEVFDESDYTSAELEDLLNAGLIEAYTVGKMQKKSVTITENGTTKVNADEDYDGLSEVNITTNVE